jgi:hypothetical protein
MSEPAVIVEAEPAVIVQPEPVPFAGQLDSYKYNSHWKLFKGKVALVYHLCGCKSFYPIIL